MIEMLLTLPSWLLFILIVGGGIALSLAATLLLRHRIKLLVRDTPNDIIGFIFAVVGVIYAVLLAFVVVVVWQDFDAANRSVSAEAAAVITLARHSTLFPEPQRSQIHDGLHRYCELVVNNKWHFMRLGQAMSVKASPASDALNAVWAAYQQLPPSDFNAESLRALDELSKDRDLRVLSGTTGIPAPFWVALLSGAVIITCFNILFQVTNTRCHLFLILLSTSLIAICLWLIVILSNPFDGDLQISTEGFRYAIGVIDSLPR